MNLGRTDLNSPEKERDKKSDKINRKKKDSNVTQTKINFSFDENVSLARDIFFIKKEVFFFENGII